MHREVFELLIEIENCLLAVIAGLESLCCRVNATSTPLQGAGIELLACRGRRLPATEKIAYSRIRSPLLPSVLVHENGQLRGRHASTDRLLSRRIACHIASRPGKDSLDTVLSLVPHLLQHGLEARITQDVLVAATRNIAQLGLEAAIGIVDSSGPGLQPKLVTGQSPDLIREGIALCRILLQLREGI